MGFASRFGHFDQTGDASGACAWRERDVARKEGWGYVQNVTVAEDGGEVVLEVFHGLKLIAPSLYGMVVPLESIVRAGEKVDDGSDGASG